jgi:hypothetical protein
MPRKPQRTGSTASITTLARVRNLKDSLHRLRTRLYPILSQWPDHNLTRDDNFYGFALLDMLRDELNELESSLSKHPRRQVDAD